MPRKEDPIRLEPASRDKLRAALQVCRPIDLAGDGARYLASRGLDAHAVGANDTKESSSWIRGGHAIVFAVRNEAGSVVAAQGRYVDAKAGPKTKSYGRIGAGVYATAAALDRRIEAVAITEAPIDALSMAVCGLPAIALCGRSNRPAWLRKALALKSVIVALDADGPGEESALEIVRWLDLGSRCHRFPFPAGAKDVNDALHTNSDRLYEIVSELRHAL